MLLLGGIPILSLLPLLRDGDPAPALALAPGLAFAPASAASLAPAPAAFAVAPRNLEPRTLLSQIRPGSSLHFHKLLCRAHGLELERFGVQGLGFGAYRV